MKYRFNWELGPEPCSLPEECSGTSEGVFDTDMQAQLAAEEWVEQAREKRMEWIAEQPKANRKALTALLSEITFELIEVAE
jgi:hypothetical protein